MADTITFEELAPAAPQSLTSGGLFPVTGFAFVDLPADGLFGYSEFLLEFAEYSYAIDAPEVGVGYGEFDLVMAFSLIPALVEVDVYGELPVYCLGTTDPLLGRGLLEVHCAAAISAAGAGYDSVFEDLIEGFLFTDGVAHDQGVALVARFIASADAMTLGRFSAELVQTMRLSDAVGLILQEALADGVLIDAVLAGDRRVLEALLATMRLTDVPTVDALAAIVDGVALADLITLISEGEITDIANLADTLEVKANLLETIVANAVLTDTLTPMAVMTVLVSDTLVLDEELTTSASLLASLAEAVEFGVSLSIDGLPYFAMSMNAATKGVTEYSNYEFTALTEFNGTVYGVDGTGLHRMEGADDAGTPIAASLRTPLLRLGAGTELRIDSAYLGYRSDGTLQMKVVYIDARGSKRGEVYDLQELPARDQRPGRIKVGKGLKSVYWAFELSNSDGADFDLDALEILPLVTARRIF